MCAKHVGMFLDMIVVDLKKPYSGLISAMRDGSS
jgi:hypothetical protein